MWRSEEEVLALVRARAGAIRRRRRQVRTGALSVGVATLAAIVAVTLGTAGTHPTRVDVGGSHPSPPALTTVPTAPTTIPPPTISACPPVVRLAPGSPVAAYRLGAIDFASASRGVALTAGEVSCGLIDHGRGGDDVSQQEQSQRLAVTLDGGRTWTVRGAALAPVGETQPYLERVVAVSGSDIWAVDAQGTLLRTTSGGSTWVPQPVPGPVVDLAQVGGSIWAVDCPRVGTSGRCTPVLRRQSLTGGPWETLPLPPLPSDGAPQLVVASAQVVLLLVVPSGDSRGTLEVTADGGARWTLQATPESRCISDVGITASGPQDWWLLCTAGAAMGASSNELAHTSNGGRSWSTVAGITNLEEPVRPGQLSRGDPTAVTAGSTARLWLATDNQLTVSGDGGTTWAEVAGVDPEGATSLLDAVSAGDAWLLAPGTGLWSTTDATTWHAQGPTQT